MSIHKTNNYQQTNSSNLAGLPTLQSVGRDKNNAGAQYTTSTKDWRIPKPSEVKAILEFKPERIGHGTCIHPQLGGSSELWEILLQSKIPVEACLTSNVKSRTVKHYEDHHFQYMFKHQHPITLGTDDKGVFATSLSREFQIAANTFSLSKQQMWKLSFDSVDYIFGTQQEQIHLKKVLKSWRDENMHLFETVNDSH
uniref:Adenosine deaminase domain-containing protein n=1 Tax=Timema shepardi TaxID=629360 RepID=A0A7R9B9S3_TIMSH|nr:unnamed protein product [Timema shepardi]